MPHTDSASATGTVALRGVWMHDPDNPEATLRNFAFGANQRTDTYDPMGSGSYYAGRSAPVFDYGDPEAETWDITIDVPHGATYHEDLSLLREFVKARRPIWIRDNRGRAMYGTIGAMKVSDQPYGNQVSFLVTAAHREIVEAIS